MPFDSSQAPVQHDLSRRADEVVAGFGLRPTRSNLLDMAAEVERRLHVFPGGPSIAWRVAAELRRRALDQRGR